MNPEYDAQGAMQASCIFNNLSKIKVTGYRFLNDAAFTADQKKTFEENPELRKISNILDDNEVRSQVLQKIAEIPRSIQVSTYFSYAH